MDPGSLWHIRSLSESVSYPTEEAGGKELLTTACGWGF